MNRFFIEPASLTGNEVELDGEITHQLIRVLRLESGAHIILLDGQGFEYEAELLEGRRQAKTDLVRVKILEKRAAPGEPRTKITLYQALLKGEKFDFVLQKSTEIGVTAIVPVLTERCISQGARPDRWRKIIREAAEQSRRGRLPDLTGQPLNLNAALQQIKASGSLGLMAWEEEHHTSLKMLNQEVKELSLLVGPEGGFSPAEAKLASDCGIQTVSMGPRILRAETAGPVIVALALYQLGDME